ncbi:MAG TPA: DUF2235 domain-containing protein [Candidatus Binatia bacterium]
MTQAKKLIVCADGTWNDEDGAGGPTNVVKIHRLLKNNYVEGVNQWTCYVTGVGTLLRDRVRGGAFGYGLSKNILQAYRFLIDQYDEGAELYFFGFSRGAYTVRSLAGLIRNSGILRHPCVDRIDDAYALYRNRSDKTHPKSDMAAEFRKNYSFTPEIKFIGVWDTVGSLGVPLPGLRLVALLARMLNKDYEFHDTELSSCVKHAYHAVSIHEKRSTFTPTLWQKQDHSGDQVLEQVWFPGVHCDVGGGYRSAGLSDASLVWMIERAKECDLLFRDDALKAGINLAPDSLGRIHNSYAFPFNVIDWTLLKFGGAPRSFSTEPEYCSQISQIAKERFRNYPNDDWPASFRHVME